MIYPYETAQKMSRTHECADCGGSSTLVVRWWKGNWDLVCGRCKGESFRERKSITKMWRENPDSVPLHIANRLEKKYGGSRMSDTALVKANESQIVQRLTMCLWAKDMTTFQKTALAQLAIQYRLDPLMGELIWYEGAPYITVEGRIRRMNASPDFGGWEERPMTEQERTEYGLKKPVAWICKVYKKGMVVPAVGIGEADPEKPHRSKLDSQTKKWVGGNFIEREEPWRLARSRARRDAVKQYFPHNLPIKEIEDAGIEFDTVSGRMVDMGTGEIIEGNFRRMTDTPQAPLRPEKSDGGQMGDPPGEVANPQEAPKVEGDPQGPSTPEPDPTLFQPTPRDLTIRRIEEITAKAHRARDDQWYAYFHMFAGVPWEEATDEQLDRFLSHITDTYEAAKQKKRERAKAT